MKVKLLLLSLFVLVASPVLAEKLQASQTCIVNLAQVLAEIKGLTSVPVVFPAQVPAPAKSTKLYASFRKALATKDGYLISVDETADCDGAHYCSAGTLKVSRDGRPRMYRNMKNKRITRVISLSETQKAYYTPGHAMADYWAPRLEWRDADCFYQLTWNVKQRGILLKMAKSLGH